MKQTIYTTIITDDFTLEELKQLPDGTELMDKDNDYDVWEKTPDGLYDSDEDELWEWDDFNPKAFYLEEKQVKKVSK
jgi:hypothetical protein